MEVYQIRDGFIRVIINKSEMEIYDLTYENFLLGDDLSAKLISNLVSVYSDTNGYERYEVNAMATIRHDGCLEIIIGPRRKITPVLVNKILVDSSEDSFLDNIDINDLMSEDSEIDFVINHIAEHVIENNFYDEEDIDNYEDEDYEELSNILDEEDLDNDLPDFLFEKHLVYSFRSFDDFIGLVKGYSIKDFGKNRLYFYEGKYYLLFTFYEDETYMYKHLEIFVQEYGNKSRLSAHRLLEYGKLIAGKDDDAVSELSEYF